MTYVNANSSKRRRATAILFIPLLRPSLAVEPEIASRKPSIKTYESLARKDTVIDASIDDDHVISLIRGGDRHDGKRATKVTNKRYARNESLTTSKSRIKSIATTYDSFLKTHPITTKSITSGIMFGVSDIVAQSLQSKESPSSLFLHWFRVQTNILVGFLYFGPAAHYWYSYMFQRFPDTTIKSNLLKSALGQLVFGPIFMVVFFGATLLQQDSFNITTFLRKIATDLPKAWLAGLYFWPLASFISYSFIPKDWIPLFSNVCTLLFNIFLSLVAYSREANKS